MCALFLTPRHLLFVGIQMCFQAEVPLWTSCKGGLAESVNLSDLAYQVNMNKNDTCWIKTTAFLLFRTNRSLYFPNFWRVVVYSQMGLQLGHILVGKKTNYQWLETIKQHKNLSKTLCLEASPHSSFFQPKELSNTLRSFSGTRFTAAHARAASVWKREVSLGSSSKQWKVQRVHFSLQCSK